MSESLTGQVGFIFLPIFSFIITYSPGEKNAKADALSRSFISSPKEDSIPVSIVPKEVIVATLSSDLHASLSETQVNVTSNVPPGKLFVPENLFEAVFLEAHDSKIAGHPGSSKTCSLLTQTLWWPTLRQDVGNYIDSCPVCHCSKPSRSLPQGLLQSLPIPEKPWTHISVDFIVELPLSLKGILSFGW